jgi:hypothetical protein
MEEQTTQWPKEKGQKDKQRSTKHYTHKQLSIKHYPYKATLLKNLMNSCAPEV